MKIARIGPPASPRSSTSASKLRTCRPKALRSRADVHQAQVLAVEHDQPGARAEHGRRRSRARAAAPARPSRSIPSVIVVDSPPGHDEAVELAADGSLRRDAHLSRASAAAEAQRTRHPLVEGLRSRTCSASEPPRIMRPTRATEDAAAKATGRCYQPRWASSCSSSSLELSRLAIARPEAAGRGGDALGVLPVRGCVDDRPRARRRVVGLEDARPHEHAFGAERHHQRRVRRRRDAAGAEQHDGQPPVARDVADELERRAAAPWPRVGSSSAPSTPRRAISRADAAHVAHRLDDVAGARLALGADHRRALADPAQRLAEVRRAADERHLEVPLVDVVALVGGREHLGLVDVVDLERLEHARLHEVADAGLGHHRDAHRRLDARDHLGVRHPRDAAVAADVRRDALERHHRGGAGVLGDLRLLGRDHVHDHAALEHLREAGLDPECGLVAHRS